MRRAALIVFLAWLTFDVSGATALCAEASCDEPCPTDVSGGQCPPNCHYCSCCSLPSTTGAASPVALIAPSAHATSWIRTTDRLPSPEPAEILHVPRLAIG